PHPDAAPVTLRPRPAGVAPAGLNGVGGLTPDPEEATPTDAGTAVASGGGGDGQSDGSGTETLVDNVSFAGDVLAAAEWTDHRLLYATPELARPVHISGTAEVTVRLAASEPAVNLSVWLVSLPWQGRGPTTDDVITRGWADPQNRASLRESEPLVPGRFYDVTFTLQPDDQVIPAGERIGLMIFSSDRDFTLWPRPGAELTVDLGGTSVTLPVVEGVEALRQ
ncbi:MAG: CocE/NonD family hydrolase C-terminal non-catalytic domain-containing protein, partial [Gemmatimonadota bacterium]